MSPKKQNLPIVPMNQAVELKDQAKPREKLQSQLNTIMPMEIVRAQPFFSKNSHILRDKLEEYVNGFPATRGHRKVIAEAYNMQQYEINESGAQVKIE